MQENINKIEKQSLKLKYVTSEKEEVDEIIIFRYRDNWVN